MSSDFNRRAMRALNESHWRDPETYRADLSTSRAWLAALRKKYQDAVVDAPSRMWFRYDPRYWWAYRVRTGRSPWRAIQAGDRWIAQRRYAKYIAYERALVRRLSQSQ